MQQRSRFLFSFTLLVHVSKSVAHLETGKSSSQALKNVPAHLSHRKLQWNEAGSDRKAELLRAAGDRSPHCHKRRLCKLQVRLVETFVFYRGPQFLLCALCQQSVIELSDPRYFLLSLLQRACNIGQIFHSKATEFYYDYVTGHRFHLHWPTVLPATASDVLKLVSLLILTMWMQPV